MVGLTVTRFLENSKLLFFIFFIHSRPRTFRITNLQLLLHLTPSTWKSSSLESAMGRTSLARSKSGLCLPTWWVKPNLGIATIQHQFLIYKPFWKSFIFQYVQLEILSFDRHGLQPSVLREDEQAVCQMCGEQRHQQHGLDVPNAGPDFRQQFSGM